MDSTGAMDFDGGVGIASVVEDHEMDLPVTGEPLDAPISDRPLHFEYLQSWDEGVVKVFWPLDVLEWFVGRRHDGES